MHRDGSVQMRPMNLSFASHPALKPATQQRSINLFTLGQGGSILGGFLVGSSYGDKSMQLVGENLVPAKRWNKV